MGHKQNCPPDQWSELSISRAPRVSQTAVGHDGQHALILGETGEVFFVGTARRGEDGDQSGKNRRQPKAAKPKRMSKTDGINVVQVAANNGTSALVAKDGALYLFGKDATHADYNSGLVTDLKGSHIIQVSTYCCASVLARRTTILSSTTRLLWARPT